VCAPTLPVNVTITRDSREMSRVSQTPVAADVGLTTLNRSGYRPTPKAGYNVGIQVSCSY